MYRVLLADDEQIERMALAKKLSRHFGESCVIYEAVNGAEAVEVFSRERCQIVIMDIAMPELNGVEAAERIRELDEDCMIIFLTAYDEFTYARRAIVIRALDYLLKPCEEEELISVMEEAMRQTDRRLNQQVSGVNQRQNHGKNQEQGQNQEQNQEQDYNQVQKIGIDWERSVMAEGVHIPAMEEDGGTGRMAQIAGAIQEYIRNNYMKEISMQDAARVMEYSDAYFSKLFKQCFDQNFTTYLAKFRIQEAKKLLRNKNINVKDVGKQVGYYDSNYFAKVFKRMTGMIPSEYRDSVGKQEKC